MGILKILHIKYLFCRLTVLGSTGTAVLYPAAVHFSCRVVILLNSENRQMSLKLIMYK